MEYLSLSHSHKYYGDYLFVCLNIIISCFSFSSINFPLFEGFHITDKFFCPKLYTSNIKNIFFLFSFLVKSTWWAWLDLYGLSVRVISMSSLLSIRPHVPFFLVKYNFSVLGLQAWESFCDFCWGQLCSLIYLLYVVVYTTEKIALFYTSEKGFTYVKTQTSLKVALSEILWHFQQI